MTFQDIVNNCNMIGNPSVISFLLQMPSTAKSNDLLSPLVIKVNVKFQLEGSKNKDMIIFLYKDLLDSPVDPR